VSKTIVPCVLRILVCLGVFAVSAVGCYMPFSAAGDWTGHNPSGPETGPWGMMYNGKFRPWSYMNSSGWGQPFSIDTFYMNPQEGYWSPQQVPPGFPPWYPVDRYPWYPLDPYPPYQPELSSWSNGIGQPGVLYEPGPLGAFLQLDAETGATAVRFTSPETRLYAINGLFQDIDNDSLNPVHLGVIVSGSAALVDMDGFGGSGSFGEQLRFCYPEVYLPASTTLDFIVAESSGSTHFSTGLSVWIDRAAPEPAAYCLVAAGLALMVFIRRSCKRSDAGHAHEI